MSNAKNKDIKFEILLSSMNRVSLDFLETLFPEDSFLNFNILIINQTTNDKLLSSNYNNIRVINSFKKGLSTSRNVALKKAIGEICLLADDDVRYKKNMDKIIIQAFNKKPNADIITFKMQDLEGHDFKNYTNQTVHDKNTIKTVNSVVIALKPKQVLDKKAQFNVNFGLGSFFETADEYVFLRNALRAKLNLFFEPKIILSHDYNSSGRDSGSDRLVYARAALFYKYSGVIGYLKLIKYLYLITNNNELHVRKLYSKFLIGLKGIKKYRELVKNDMEIR
jgi:glycosyltransferase involved in cell wall biosynthesis